MRETTRNKSEIIHCMEMSSAFVNINLVDADEHHLLFSVTLVLKVLCLLPWLATEAVAKNTMCFTSLSLLVTAGLTSTMYVF